MSPHESSLITQLIDEVSGLRDEVRGLRDATIVIQTKLFGDANEENKEGRIPRLEETQKSHETRIRHQERREWIWRGVCLLAGIIVTTAAFLYHFKQVMGH